MNKVINGRFYVKLHTVCHFFFREANMKLYEKILEDIKKKIVEEKMLQGSKLPSINQLCKQYNCSKGSVIKAYDFLCRKHIVYSSPQRGFFVADNLVKYSKNDSSVYDLSNGNPLVSSIPVKDIQHCLNSAIELYSDISLAAAYTSYNGIPTVFEILPDILKKSDIYCNKENIYLSQGVLQVLTLLSKMPFPNGNDTILIEEPSYVYYIHFLKEENLKVRTIKRDENGINLKELEEIFKTEKIKFFYTIPRNNNPLGTYYTLKQRKEIIRLAHKYNVYIVEDDYFSDVYNIPNYSPLYYYSDFKNCIYLKSYSKTIPYIRIGTAIIPDDLIDTYKKWIEYSYYYSYYMPSLVSQATFESYIKSGIYDKHIKIIDSHLKELLKIFKNITSKWDSNIVKVIGGCSGYYSTLVLNKKIKSNKLLENLKKRNILVSSNKEAYYNVENFDNSIRISIARLNAEQLKTVLDIIYEEILLIFD